jgi:hypothetical protein
VAERPVRSIAVGTQKAEGRRQSGFGQS